MTIRQRRYLVLYSTVGRRISRFTGKAAYSIPLYSNSSPAFLPTPGKGRRLG
jgi:hypothetical protein